MSTIFTWLHLSDLHVGHKAKLLWPSVKDEFFDDLDYYLKKICRLDMVLFTGDLTQGGKEDEFTELESFLAELWEHFSVRKLSPHFIAIPGNHDLVRPDPADPALLNLVHLWELEEQLRTAFLDKKRKSVQRELVERVFTNYNTWWDKKAKMLGKSYTPGLLPGDFSATIKKDNIKLGIVGLNSAFLHLKDGMKELVTSPEQLESACGGNASDWTKNHDTSLLLTHHPVTWLSRASRLTFDQQIHSPKRFAFHLFGHMHKPEIESQAYGAGLMRNRFQGFSLFGLEKWGEVEKVERIHGYSLYEFKFNDSSAHWRVWPREGKYNKNNEFSFSADSRFVLKKGSQCTRWIPVDLPNRKFKAIKAKVDLPNRKSKAREVNAPRIAAFVGPQNFDEVHAVVISLLKMMQDSERSSEVLNIALDMEYTWGVIKDSVLKIKWPHTMKWRSLMVDPRQYRNSARLNQW